MAKKKAKAKKKPAKKKPAKKKPAKRKPAKKKPAKKKPTANRAKKAPAVPKVLVCLGDCLEIELSGGSVIKCRGFKLCAPLIGKGFLYGIAAGKGSFSQSVPKKALKLYKLWHDYEARSARTTKIDERGLKSIGKAASITYRSKKWAGKSNDYIHEFDTRPEVYQNKTLIVLSGRSIKITSRGITG